MAGGEGRNAVVVGAGIGGLAAAIALQRGGFETRVVERAPQLAPLGAGLVLWPNAVHALRHLGLGDEIARFPSAASAGGMRSKRGELLLGTDPREIERRFGAPTVVIHRADLQSTLLGALGDARVELGAELAGFEQHAGSVRARLTDGRVLEADLLVGADGIGSRVREELIGDGPPRQAGYVAWRAVLRHDAAGLPVGELWGPGALFGFVPLGDGRLYWYATEPGLARGDAPAQRKQHVLARFAAWHPAIARVVEATDEGDILRHDVVDRDPRRGWSQGRVTLLGDAAHPMTPHLGQGACQAIEDAVVLGECVAATGGVATALQEYERRRFARTKTLVLRSRQVGRMAQLRRPVSRRVRDFALQRIPAPLQMRQLAPVVGWRP